MEKNASVVGTTTVVGAAAGYGMAKASAEEDAATLTAEELAEVGTAVEPGVGTAIGAVAGLVAGEIADHL